MNDTPIELVEFKIPDAKKSGKGWSEPARPAMLPWQPFPVDALPEPIRGFVAGGAKALGCDASMIVLPLLAGLASAIGATRRIELKSGWTEPAVVWSAVVAESGTLKTPAQGLALNALRKLQGWSLQEYPRLLEQYGRDKILYEADLSQWKKTGRKKGEPMPKKPEEPTVRRYIVSDTTIEALADRLQSAPRGLLVDVDELAGWLSSFDKYRSGRGGDVSKWLSMHRAESLVIDRKMEPKTLFIPRAAVSVCGGVQPKVLSRALAGEHTENGLAARLLLVCPPRQPKRWTEAIVDPALAQAVERVFGRLLAMDFTADSNDSPMPVNMPLAPDAKRTWIKFYNSHALEQSDLSGDLAAAWSKLEGYAARLALIVHCARVAADDPAANPQAVDEVSIQAGIALSKWFGHEAKRVYAILDESDEGRDRRRLAEWIGRKGGSVTVREAQQGNRRLQTADDAEAALSELAKGGVGRWEALPTTAQGGRPTRVFRLSTPSTVHETPANPEENGGFVDVDTVGSLKNTDPVNGLLSEAAAAESENPVEWGEV